MARLTWILSSLLIALAAGGCEFLGDVVEFGFWLGLIVLLLIVAVIWGVVRLMRGGGRS